MSYGRVLSRGEVKGDRFRENFLGLCCVRYGFGGKFRELEVGE